MEQEASKPKEDMVKILKYKQIGRWKSRLLMMIGIAAVILRTIPGNAVNISAVASDGGNAGSFRWIVEEDLTYQTIPGEMDPHSQAVSFHRSYMPVVATGTSANPTIALDPLKHYYVSVLPDSGYTIGGAQIAPGQETVNVYVNKLPLPTAQITVFVFEDNNPINNAPDEPQETGLEGFSVTVTDAGGRYGQVGGQMMTDAYGNPFGTTYDPDGNVITMGKGTILTDANGMAIIKNLYPGKYTIQVVPPAGKNWQQTSTIEGTKGIDAWVKANEPAYFQEFGPPGYHVFVGFVRPMNDETVLTGGSTITGRIVNLHMSRPPDYTFHAGAPFEHTTPWVGLNEGAAGTGRGIFAMRCNSDGSFSIPNVPAGQYQLVVWDDNLDIIFAFLSLDVPEEGGNVMLGDVPVFNWFGSLMNLVFFDANSDGFMNDGEMPMKNQNVNIRFRDGTIYQSATTNVNGEAFFDEVFPFFNWLVAEVDFARFKATGVTVVVDAGGAIDLADPYSFGGRLNPQPQSENGLAPYRTETGVALTEAFQLFLGQTNVLLWGKQAYSEGENGGISGIVFYDTTRAENDPRYCFGEPFQPGIPNVVMNLYADGDIDNFPLGNFPGAEDIDRNDNGLFDAADGVIDDIDGDNIIVLSDADNYPFGNFPGVEDIDRNDNGTLDYGDAIQTTVTDSWDDSTPTGAQGPPFIVHGVPTDCYDGLRNFNQARPGVFDGGYAFDSWFPGGIASGSGESDGLPAGTYIVEMVPPRSPIDGSETYKVVKEEDKNVDFGDEYMNPLLLPAVPVGDMHVVPDFLSLFPGVPCVYAGESRPLCDRKQIMLNDAQNAAADFFLFTDVPIAGHLTGFILDDLSNEFDPASPQFGEKYAPPWLPVSIRDWTGREISRVYSDEWGNYNALVPSTYTTNAPSPSGISPNMVTVALNDPGFIPDQGNPENFVTDPFYNPQYSQFSYTFQYMPGTTTYLDTPVVPVAAFAGPDQYPLDCELPDGTPRIYTVNGPDGGPYASGTGQQVTIVSKGTQSVLNPSYDGPGGSNSKNIQRDYGFGNTEGTVMIGGKELSIDSWDSSSITGTLSEGTVTGQLVVTRGDNGRKSIAGITMTIGGTEPVRVQAGGSIQEAIDSAQYGDLILVPPGNYYELLIMWKPVKLQGYGEGSTIINAVKTPSEKLAVWRQKVEGLVANGSVNLLPGQAIGMDGFEPGMLFTEQGSGILVLAKNDIPSDGGFGLVEGVPNSRIDGFTVTGGDTAGGIVVNGYARNLEISNNLITGNAGVLGGGVRIGHPSLVTEGPGGEIYQGSYNEDVRIHHNHIKTNAGMEGSGGGISIYAGADGYQIMHNAICGNFSMGEGAGIGHMGLSNDGLIMNNFIMFNQTFNQATTVSGGGINIMGEAPLIAGSLSPGAGSVKIISNLIQGNNAGAGDGGGIRVNRLNGQDVADASETPESWYVVEIFNNMIVNNVAGLAGGGISLQDAAMVKIINNTISSNDSTATAGEAFTPGQPERSNPQPAGIVSRGHTAALRNAFAATEATEPYREFSNPALLNNIVYQNRSFYFVADNTMNPPVYGLLPDVSNGEGAVYNDLAVLGTMTPQMLSPMYCLITDTTGYDATNISDDPLFIDPYFNGARNSIIYPESTTAIQVAAAFDEGGNFIDVHFGPLTMTGNYHIAAGSPAVDTGSVPGMVEEYPELAVDIDRQKRPVGDRVDVGADESSNEEAGQGEGLFKGPGDIAPMDDTGDAPATRESGHGCFIATAAFGSYQEKHVQILREFRDRYLLTNAAGRAFVRWYYLHSPAFADMIRGNETARSIVRIALMPAYAGAWALLHRMVFTYGFSAALLLMLILLRKRRSAHLIMILAGFLTLPVALSAAVNVQLPGDTDGDCLIDAPDPEHPNAVGMHLAAGDGFAVMADGTVMYCFGFSNVTGIMPDMVMHHGMLGANLSSPTIVLDEGDEFYLTLTNVGMMLRPDLFDPHTVHWHGFPQAASIFDGVPDASIAINMGASLTYYYNVVEPGTYFYHCHVEATEHMQMGMIGNLYVRPAQDKLPSGTNLNGFLHQEGYRYAYNDEDGSTYYDVDYPVQITSFDPLFHDASVSVQPLPFAYMDDKYPLFNGRGYPDTVNPAALPAPQENGGKVSQKTSSLITAQPGQKILLRISNSSVTEFFTVTALGIPMQVVGQDARLLRGPSPDGGITPGRDLDYMTSSVTVGGGESRDVILDTAGVPAGTYFLYTTNLNFLSNGNEDFGGLMTEIVIGAE